MEKNENFEAQQKKMKDALDKYYSTKNENNDTKSDITSKIPEQINLPKSNLDSFQTNISKETDPDLMMTYEIVSLPSKGLFYQNKFDKVQIEYLTSKDEDLLTTPSFIDDGSVIDRLLERKIVEKIDPRTLLSGDRSAIMLFLRMSSYGNKYNVTVTDPRNGRTFESTVDLSKLSYKELTKIPDENGEFTVEIPMRKKIVKFRLLNSGEENAIFKNAEARKDAYNLEFSEYNTLRLKSSIQEIGGKRDRSYIDRFVDVMPALDAYTIRKEILDVSPDINMSYEFKTKDGYVFTAPLSMGIDFFFPSL